MLRRYITHAGSMLSTVYSMLGISTAGTSQRNGTGSNRGGAEWLIGNLSLPEGWEQATIERVFLGGVPYVASGVHGSRLTLKELE